MIASTTPISQRLSKLLALHSIDLHQVARMPDADVLKLEGFGRAALKEARAATPYVYYDELLTTERARGCILVVNPDKSREISVLHLLALLASARGFAVTTKGDGSQLAFIRYLSYEGS